MGLNEDDDRKKEVPIKERKTVTKENKLQLSQDFIRNNDTLNLPVSELVSEKSFGLNTHEVIKSDPDATENKNKTNAKLRTKYLKITLSVYEKRLIEMNAKRCRLPQIEFCRIAIFQAQIKERLSDQHINIYKTLVSLFNELKAEACLHREKNPELSERLYDISRKVKSLLQTIIK